MEVNAIVSLLLSHQFDAARALWRKIKVENKHTALPGIGVFFNLKDKKHTEALTLLDGERDIFAVFLRSQILLSDKKPRQALVNLAENFDNALVANSGYCNLLLRSALSLDLSYDEMKKMVDAV